MAQWVASANSLGHRYIDDPRVDEQARIGQLLMAERAQRQDEAMRREAMAFQAQQAAERARQFDAELGSRRDAEAFQAFQWLTGQDTAAAERQRQQENADRLFAAQRDEVAQRLGLERSQEERLREAALFARRQAEDPRAREAEQAKLELLRAQIEDYKRRPEQARLDDERQAAIRKDVAEVERQRAVAVAEAQERARGVAQGRLYQQSVDREDYLREKDDAKRRAEEAKASEEARLRTAAGLRGTVSEFSQALERAPKFKAGSRVSETDRATAEAQLLPLIQRAFLGGGEPDLDPIRGGKRPGWAPTTPGEEAALVEALRRVLAERYPEVSRGAWWNPFDDETPKPFFDEDPVAKVQSRWGTALFAPR